MHRRTGSPRSPARLSPRALQTPGGRPPSDAPQCGPRALGDPPCTQPMALGTSRASCWSLSFPSASTHPSALVTALSPRLEELVRPPQSPAQGIAAL